MAVKTLLDPLRLGQTPRRQKNVPGRHTKSWAYQDEQSRYFMGTFTPEKITAHPTDRLYVLEAGDVARPDLISYKFYGTTKFYWILMWINDILDPFEEMYPGMLLRIPTQIRLAQFDVRA